MLTEKSSSDSSHASTPAIAARCRPCQAFSRTRHASLRLMPMRSFLVFSFCSITALAAQQVGGCPDIERAAQTYIAQNLSSDEEKPAQLAPNYHRVAANVSAVQLLLPFAGEGDGAPQLLVLFFAGKDKCSFVYQADGEITEQLQAGATRYVFIRTESVEGDQTHIDYQVLTVHASGDVVATRDQHGQDIYFSETRQKRCHGQVGDVLSWSRDSSATGLIIVRQQHIDRDGKCRITEDSSTYRYYTLGIDFWMLDDGEEEPGARPSKMPMAPVEYRRDSRQR